MTRFSQRDRIVSHLRLHALDMRERLGLTHVETFLDDALGADKGTRDQRAGVAGRQLSRKAI